MEQKIIEIIADYQGKDASEYKADQTFTSMGLDSLDLANDEFKSEFRDLVKLYERNKNRQQ